MDHKENPPKPSRTAFFNALHRALAHKMYGHVMLANDDLAEIFLPGYYRFFLKFSKIQKNTKQKLDNAFPGLNAYVTARTAFFDQIFTQALSENIPQIVILGAGYDSRPYRFAELNHNTRIFELDNPATQIRKKRCLEKAGIGIPNLVKFLPVDLNEVPLSSALDSAGYKNDKKSLFIWEGVSYYLDPGSVAETISFFSNFCHKDSLLVFDYMATLNNENADDLYGARSFLQSMQEEHADEEMTFSIKEGDVESYLDQKGVSLVEHLNSEEIEKKYLIDENGNLIDRIIEIFRFAVVNPK